MASNAQIIMGVRPLEIEDPVAQYSRLAAIQGAQQQNQLARMKMDEYGRTRQQEEGLRNYLTQSDLKTPEGRAGLMQYGAPGLAINKSLSEQNTAGLTQQKLQFETAAAKQKFIAQAQRDTSQNPSDANITAYKEDLIANPLFSDSEKQQMAANADRLLAMPVEERKVLMSSRGATSGELKPSTQVVNRSGQSDLVRVPAFGGAPVTAGTYADVPLPPEVQAQKLQSARASAPKTAITLGGNKYAENVGGDIGKDDVETYKFAQTIPSALNKIKETIDILKNSDINTGLGAQLFTTFDRAKTKFAADEKAGVRVSNTEYLNSLLGSEVFPLIQSLGIGARGMDTPAEREFLRAVMTGTIELNKDTLIRMAEGRRKAMIGAAEQYNKNVKSGELDRFFEASGRNKSTIEIPSQREAAVGVPAKAIEYLRANPNTRAQFEQRFPGVSVDQILGQR
jgi:hypothetical protein